MNVPRIRDQPSSDSTLWRDYALVDFGAGRKLERFGGWLVDRPAPVAVDAPRLHPASWASAAVRYEADRAGSAAWVGRQNPWSMTLGRTAFHLRPTAAGQVGVFPEQVANWEWIRERIRTSPAETFRVLNLFAYTGGSTLAAAQCGAEVVHVDAQKSVVDWARHNAAGNRLDSARIRWIVDDARKFVRRELRRGQHYQGIILDPPSYGHGRHGEPWQLARDLPQLLDELSGLLQGPGFVVCSCHATRLDAKQLTRLMRNAFPDMMPSDGKHVVPLELLAEDGRRLPSGIVARWVQRSTR